MAAHGDLAGALPRAQCLAEPDHRVLLSRLVGNEVCFPLTHACTRARPFTNAYRRATHRLMHTCGDPWKPGPEVKQSGARVQVAASIQRGRRPCLPHRIHPHPVTPRGERAERRVLEFALGHLMLHRHLRPGPPAPCPAPPRLRLPRHIRQFSAETLPRTGAHGSRSWDVPSGNSK